jgi:hypothetical protein
MVDMELAIEVQHLAAIEALAATAFKDFTASSWQLGFFVADAWSEMIIVDVIKMTQSGRCG